MKPTNRDVKIIYGSNIVTANDDERVIANCGGYQSNRKGEDARAESIANAELIEVAWNACRAINPADPLAAAKAMPGVVTALETILDEVLLPYTVAQQAKTALAALKGETNVSS